MPPRPPLSLPRLIVLGGFLLFAAPWTAGLLVVLATNARNQTLWMAGWTLVCFAAFMTFVLIGYERRVRTPLKRFHTTLEDISEGFIGEELPIAEWKGAEPGIASAAKMVLQINKQLLRTVDNLEQGFEEERLAIMRQLELTRAYERFVPHQFISFLRKESITQVRLGDHVDTEMTILFSDMRSFTSLSEFITPEENFNFLNSYLRRMDPVIRHNGGFIDKYIGDAIMALFAESPDEALQASIDMLRELEDYNAGRRRAGYTPIRIGIGINTGRMMLGIVGGDNRMEGTVISDAVNLASRMEEMNKTYGTTVLITESTVASLSEPDRFEIRYIDRVQAKGKQMPVRIYELYGADPEPLRASKLATKERFEQAVELYHRDDKQSALELFRECSALAPDDTVVALYLSKLPSHTPPAESR